MCVWGRGGDETMIEYTMTKYLESKEFNNGIMKRFNIKIKDASIMGGIRLPAPLDQPHPQVIRKLKKEYNGSISSDHSSSSNAQDQSLNLFYCYVCEWSEWQHECHPLH